MAVGRSPFRVVGALAGGAALMCLGVTAQAKQTWTLVYSDANSGNALFGLSAVDATHAWAVGVTSSMGNSQAVGVRTMDGTSFYPMTLPPGNGGPMALTMYTSLAFLDTQTGWMHGATFSMAGTSAFVWKTTDGGSSWNPVFQSPNLMNQLQALPDGAVFGAGANLVLVSKDGSSFVEKAVPVPSGMELHGIAMLNSTCGFAVAGALSDLGGMGSAVLWTEDGGESWVTRGEGREFQANRAWFVTPTLGWIAGSQSGRAIVAKTTDGGNTWTPVGIPDHPPPMGSQPFPATDCVDVKFFDDTRGVAACLSCTAECDGGEDANPSYLTVFVRSEDGGQSWTMDPDYEAAMAAPPFPAMSKFSGMLAMAFPDPNNGYLAGQNNLILRYAAAVPEAAAWPPSGCDGNEAGGGNAGGGGGPQAGTAGANGTASGSDSGCGCRTTSQGNRAGLGLLLLLTLASGLVLRRAKS